MSDWVLKHPVVWAVGSGVVLVGLGIAVNLAPVAIGASGAAIAVLNVLHAKKRGYCPLPAESGSCPEASGDQQRAGGPPRPRVPRNIHPGRDDAD